VALIAGATTAGIDHFSPHFAYHGVAGDLAVLCVALAWGPGPAVVCAVLSTAVLAYIVVPSGGSPAMETVAFVLSLLFSLAIAIMAGALQARRRQLIATRRELQASAAELDAALEAIPDGVVMYDGTGRLVRMNAAARRLCGETPNELAQSMPDPQPFRHVAAPHGPPFPPEHAPLLRALQGETMQGVVAQIRTPDGRTAWTANSAAPIRAADGTITGVIGSISDITDLRALQEQQADLLRTLSHDLRSPLTSVLGQAELIPWYLDAGAEPDRLRGSADAIVHSAQRMDAMIQDLVDMARGESGQLRIQRTSTDLASFLPDVQRRFARDKDRARIRLQHPPRLPLVVVDPDRLERVLTNLLSNALKYSDQATTVVLSACCVGSDVVVSVADRGAGINPDDLQHIFERYYRAGATSTREGLGLGLYISRMLVEAMGGRIWVESSVGHGSTFSITLPVVQS
jgi:PAS domain S-box-containing protein